MSSHADNFIDEGVVKAIKHYAQSPIGTVAVLSQEVGGLVLVGKWISASKLEPPFEFVSKDEWKNLQAPDTPSILKIKQPGNRPQTNRRPRKKRCKAA